MVLLKASDPYPSHSNDRLYLEASLDPDIDSQNVTFLWKSVNHDQSQNCTFLNLTESTTINSFEPNKLHINMLQPGKSYCFRVTVLTKTNETIIQKFQQQASITIPVRLAPSSGTCHIVGSAIGEALNHTFTISCSGWKTDPQSGSIWFDFYHISPTGLKTLLTAHSSGTCTTVLGSLGKNKIQVSIMDDYGSRALEIPEIEILVRESKIDAGTYLTAFKTIKSDVRMAISQANALIDFIRDRDNFGLEKRSTQNLGLLDYLAQIASSINIDYQIYGPLLTGIISKYHKQIILSPEEVVLSWGLFRNITIAMDRSGRAAKTCFPPTPTGQEILEYLIYTRDSAKEFFNSQNHVQSFMTVLNSFISCQQRRISCGEQSQKFSAGPFSLWIGSIDPKINIAGPFSFSNLRTSIGTEIGECVHYSFQLDKNWYPSTHSQQNNLDDTMFSMTFRNYSMNRSLKEPVLYSDILPVNLRTYGTRFRAGVGAGLKNVLNTGYYSPLCNVYEKFINGRGYWDNSSCTVLGTDTDFIDCTCIKLGDFTISATPRLIMAATSLTTIYIWLILLGSALVLATCCTMIYKLSRYNIVYPLDIAVVAVEDRPNSSIPEIKIEVSKQKKKDKTIKKTKNEPINRSCSFEMLRKPQS